MNRINSLFEKKKNNILSLFFTAGYPERDSTQQVLKAIQKSEADMVEIGIPFSDPVADGKVIQDSSAAALENGMNLELLLDQLEGLRDNFTKPALLMGYFNPVMQYGIEKFCERCSRAGIDGLIIPDLPLPEYKKYKEIFIKHDLLFILLVTPGTTDERMREIADEAGGFIYAVSSYSTTGGTAVSGINEDYIKKLAGICGLPVLIGFGIHDNKTFRNACEISAGGIIGSAFIKALSGSPDIEKSVIDFVNNITGRFT
ncbi:MAG: tryptophan synthase subunit alpha [Bacteroidales bacterium]|nr:tryptophan synthase subunit alpha [Bacteroidales bacterium]